MTTRYTQDEWLAIFDTAERSISDVHVDYKAPSVGTAAFAKTIDHTLLKPEATEKQIATLCEEATRHNFKVCNLFIMDTSMHLEFNMLRSMRVRYWKSRRC